MSFALRTFRRVLPFSAAALAAAPLFAERLSLTDWPEADHPDLTSPSGGEIQDSGHYRGADGAWVTDASAYLNASATYDGTHAFDDVWNADNGRFIAWSGAIWVSYAFAEPTVVDAFRLRASSWNVATRSPKHFRFWGSDDGGATWSLLDEETGETGWTANQCRLYGFLNRSAFGVYKFEVVADNGEGKVQISELELLHLGLAGSGNDPVVSVLAATPAVDGTSAVVSGRLASDGDGGGSARVWLEWGLSDAYGNSSEAQTVADGETFSFDVAGLVGGETVHYCFVAENAEGTQGATADQTFTALGGSVLAGAIEAAVDDRTLTVTGAFDLFGAGGETEIQLWASGNSSMSDVHVVARKTVTDGAPWDISYTFGNYGSYWFYVQSANSTQYASWTSRTETSTVKCAAVYQWKKTGVTAGSLTGSENYEEANGVAVDASKIGAASVVTFAGVETPEVRVRVAGYRLQVGDMRISSDAGLTNLVIVGESSFSFFPTVTVWPGAGRRVTFDGLVVNPERPAGGTYLDLAGDVALANGATFTANYSVSEETVAGSSFVVTEGGTASSLWSWRFGLGSLLHVAGGEVSGRAVELAAEGLSAPGAVRISGAAPSLSAGKMFATDAAARAQVVFEIPAGGWSDAPVWQRTSVANGTLSASDLAAFGASGAGTLVLSVDPDSPALAHKQPNIVVPLVKWESGIDPARVELSTAAGRAARLFYGYGDSPEDVVPAAEGDRPVAVWAALRPTPPGTVVVVR